MTKFNDRIASFVRCSEITRPIVRAYGVKDMRVIGFNQQNSWEWSPVTARIDGEVSDFVTAAVSTIGSGEG